MISAAIISWRHCGTKVQKNIEVGKSVNKKPQQFTDFSFS